MRSTNLVLRCEICYTVKWYNLFMRKHAMTDFGILLKSLRVGAGLTQKQLAEKLGISKNAVSYYEQSLRCPSSDILMKMAKVFHVSTDFLLGLELKKQTFDISGLTDEDIELLHTIACFLRKKNMKQREV